MHVVLGSQTVRSAVRAAAAVTAVAELSRSRCRDHAERDLDLELSLDAHAQLYAKVVRAGVEVAASG